MRPTMAQKRRHAKKSRIGRRANMISFWKNIGTEGGPPFVIMKQSNEKTLLEACVTVCYLSSKSLMTWGHE
jgi:hypothetical protein